MMQKMIADMLGITPEEMQEMLSGMQTMLKDGVTQLNAIKEQGDRIEKKLDALASANEEQKNERRDDG